MWWRAPSVFALQQATEQMDASATLPPCNKPTLCFIFGVPAGACIEVSCIKSTTQTRWHCSCVGCRGKDSSRRNQQQCNPPHSQSHPHHASWASSRFARVSRSTMPRAALIALTIMPIVCIRQVCLNVKCTSRVVITYIDRDELHFHHKHGLGLHIGR